MTSERRRSFKPQNRSRSQSSIQRQETTRRTVNPQADEKALSNALIAVNQELKQQLLTTLQHLKEIDRSLARIVKKASRDNFDDLNTLEGWKNRFWDFFERNVGDGLRYEEGVRKLKWIEGWVVDKGEPVTNDF